MSQRPPFVCGQCGTKVGIELCDARPKTCPNCGWRREEERPGPFPSNLTQNLLDQQKTQNQPIGADFRGPLGDVPGTLPGGKPPLDDIFSPTPGLRARTREQDEEIAILRGQLSECRRSGDETARSLLVLKSSNILDENSALRARLEQALAKAAELETACKSQVKTLSSRNDEIGKLRSEIKTRERELREALVTLNQTRGTARLDNARHTKLLAALQLIAKQAQEASDDDIPF